MGGEVSNKVFSTGENFYPIQYKQSGAADSEAKQARVCFRVTPTEDATQGVLFRGFTPEGAVNLSLDVGVWSLWTRLGDVVKPPLYYLYQYVCDAAKTTHEGQNRELENAYKAIGVWLKIETLYQIPVGLAQTVLSIANIITLGAFHQNLFDAIMFIEMRAFGNGDLSIPPLKYQLTGRIYPVAAGTYKGQGPNNVDQYEFDGPTVSNWYRKNLLRHLEQDLATEIQMPSCCDLSWITADQS